MYKAPNRYAELIPVFFGNPMQSYSLTCVSLCFLLTFPWYPWRIDNAKTRIKCIATPELNRFWSHLLAQKPWESRNWMSKRCQIIYTWTDRHTYTKGGRQRHTQKWGRERGECHSIVASCLFPAARQQCHTEGMKAIHAQSKYWK